jgi:SAM-dependent methyltransferase
LVCAFEVLEHIEDDEAAVAEWVEMIKPGGSLLLSVPAYSRRFAPMDVMAGHFRRYDPGQLARIFTQFGLVDVTERFYSWPLGYLLEVVRNRIDARRIREEQGSAAEHTAASGRTLQPASRVVGALIAVGISPFRWLQRLRPMSGPGLIVVGRRAE